MGCLQDAYATYIKLAKLWGNYSHIDGQRLANGQWFKKMPTIYSEGYSAIWEMWDLVFQAVNDIQWVHNVSTNSLTSRHTRA